MSELFSIGIIVLFPCAPYPDHKRAPSTNDHLGPTQEPSMNDDGLTREQLERSVQWVLAHPDPIVAEVPHELRRLWLKHALAALPDPLETNIFTVYGTGRISAEFAYHPDKTGIMLTGLGDDSASEEAPSVTRIDHSRFREIAATRFAGDFRAWTAKLAMSLGGGRAADWALKQPMFRFPCHC